MSDLTTWLDGWGLAQLAPRLAEQDIDLDALQYLTEDDLKELRAHHRPAPASAARHRGRDCAGPPSRPPSSAGDRPGAVPGCRTATADDCVFGSRGVDGTLVTRLDPEEMGVLLHAYQTCCTAAIELYGGQVSPGSAATGILAYFCYPQGHEDDAERAVRAALSIVRDVPQLRPLGDIALRVRLGIATGQVMIGEGESGQVERRRRDAEPGRPAASPGVARNGIVISAGTQRLVRGLFNCASLGAMQLKGLPHTRPVWEVHGERGGSRFDATACPRGNPDGRSRARTRPSDGLLATRRRRQQRAGGADLRRGRRRKVAHAARACARHSEPSQPNVLSLYCSAYHQASALHPVVNYYERLAGIVHNDAAEQRELAKLETRCCARAERSLEQTVPIVASLLSIPLGDRYAPLRLTPEQLKGRTSGAADPADQGRCAATAGALPGRGDVHWIDPTLSQLISRMIAALRTLLCS